MRRGLIIALAFAAAGAWAQGSIVDGTMAEGEYPGAQTQSGITMGARLSPDGTTLYLAVSAKTAGWVAIGVGSARMDGSFMAIGYVIDGKPSISYGQGKGYGHSPITATGIVGIAIESGGITTLELSMPVADYVKGKIVKLISAYGSKDDANSRHVRRTSIDYKL